MAEGSRRRPAGMTPATAPSAAPTSLEAAANQVAASALSAPQKKEPVDTDIMISTGSTLVDLAISGGIVRGGGLPGGILIEMFGRSGTGKSALMCEILGGVQRKGGKISTQDPEGRINAAYAKVYGTTIDPRFYDRPDTVVQAFGNMREFILANFRRTKTAPINAVGTDSLAALVTELEMSKDGDKMGMRRAKDFSSETRKSARDIANSGNLVVCTNQVREGEHGDITPGGGSIEFYASTRLKLTSDHAKDVRKDLVVKTLLNETDEEDTQEDESLLRDEAKKAVVKGRGKPKGETGKVEKILGIRTNVTVVKNSIDDPYRTAFVYIMFGYGIDDVRANLQWLKEMTQNKMYVTPNGKKYMAVNQAIAEVEANGLEKELREMVIDLWELIEAAMRTKRKSKVRF